MKNPIVCIVITVFFIAYSNAQEKLPIDISKSELKWLGSTLFRINDHHGIVHFKEGHFVKTGDKITGGSFIIDMNTIASIERNKPSYKNGLVNHLKNEDFFDVKKFPQAKLVITDTNYLDATHLLIKANLTIKEIALPITFKAEVNFENQQMATVFEINRTRWDITYKSPSRSINLKDNAISDTIEFEVKLSL